MWLQSQPACEERSNFLLSLQRHWSGSSIENTGICAARLRSRGRAELTAVITSSARSEGLGVPDTRSLAQAKRTPSCRGCSTTAACDCSIMALCPRRMPGGLLGKFLFSLLLLFSPKNIAIRFYIWAKISM